MLILTQTLLHFKEHKIIYWNKVQRISSLEQSHLLIVLYGFNQKK